MPIVWTDRVGCSRSAPSMPSRPRRPRRRSRRDAATSRLASTSPSRSSQGMPRRYRRRAAVSDVEADLHHVAVLDDVLLALDPQLADLLGLHPRAELQELVPADDLGADEAPFEVAVDHAGALRRLVAGSEGPGPRLLLTRGEEGPQPEELAGGAQEPRE